MKKEYVKPQNRVVILKDRLLDVINPGSTPGEGEEGDAKIHFDDNSDSDSDHDVWED